MGTALPPNSHQTNFSSSPHKRQINAFNYVSFLPGALSAYRYKAMSDNSYGPGPLTMYLMDRGVHRGTVRAGSPEKNMQVTQDQLLFLEIVTKKGEMWALRHVKSAKASIPKKTT